MAMKRKRKIIPRKAILYGSIINYILNQYDADELTVTAASMKRNINIMLKSAKMTNPIKFTTAMIQSQEVWKDTFEHFEDRKKIEIIRIISVLYDESKSEMQNLCKITDKMIDRFDNEGIFESTGTSLEIHHGSIEVGYFMVDRIRELLGKPPRENKLAGLAEKLKKKRLVLIFKVCEECEAVLGALQPFKVKEIIFNLFMKHLYARAIGRTMIFFNRTCIMLTKVVGCIFSLIAALTLNEKRGKNVYSQNSYKIHR